MKLILVTLFSLTLVACGGGGKAKLIKTIYDNITTTATVDDPDPAAGTILSWECDGYTRLNQIADGVGGFTTEEIERSADCGWNPPAEGTVVDTSCEEYTLIEQIADGEYGTTERRTDRSPECGWNPPTAGTVSETRCEDPYTLVTVFHDGEYGFYEEEEEKSEECGYVPPTVTLSKAEGDRFKPAVFDIDLGVNDSYEYESTDRTIGTVSAEDNQIIIHGDGATGTGYISIEGEEYSYEIVPEPRCESVNYTDCQGYNYSGRSAGYIYYGDDDDQIVEWEIAYWMYDNRFENVGDYFTYEKGSLEWMKVQNIIDEYNETYAASGIHVRFVLAEGNVGKAKFGTPSGYNNLPEIVRDIGNADIYIGTGNTCPSTCGCAYVSRYFLENSGGAIGGFSVCGVMTDLHELGHSIGLAHGPDNSSNEASGYIWNDFGHGHSTPFCAWTADIMSYESAIRHNNSMVTCEDQLGMTQNYLENPDAPAGSREYADSAYHINRIRYDVSLIHCEGDKCAGKPESAPAPVEGELGELVLDDVEKFQEGPEKMIREMNRLRREFQVDLSPMRPK